MYTYLVAVATPSHSGIQNGLLSYQHPNPLELGVVVLVPLGKRRVLGVVWNKSTQAPTHIKLKPILWVAPCVLDMQWRNLLGFAARYYHHSLGEMVVQALPPIWRKANEADTFNARFQRFDKRLAKNTQAACNAPTNNKTLPELQPQQRHALSTIANSQKPCLLWGVTGSGKTEVYMQWVATCLAKNPRGQALVLVPEINLTPQLESVFRKRFTSNHKSDSPHVVVSIHSGLTAVQRETNWLLAQRGIARIVLGTRTAVFTPMPNLCAIVVDEEHDASYKSQDGARYHARDLAIYRASQYSPILPVVLGSATPSMESWHACETKKYQRIDMLQRADNAELPDIQLVDSSNLPARRLLAPAVTDAIEDCLQQGKQALIFLNRRGYAPVLFCPECQWKSDCNACSAHMVLHRFTQKSTNANTQRAGQLRCHHCGKTAPAPAACPQCQHPNLIELGSGTQMLEDMLVQKVADMQTTHGASPRILRIDADNSKGKNTLEEQLQTIHNGQVDIVIGTQMVTKGHDFSNIQLVVALDCDQSLFSVDFRAPERLFSQLTQAAGRAGRRKTHATANTAKMLIQTRLPQHPLYQRVLKQDFTGFANNALKERTEAALPPFVHQAILRAESKDMERAQNFLRHLASSSTDLQKQWQVFLYPPIPMSMRKIAHMERAQMLIEASTRKALHGFLQAWKQRWQNDPKKNRQQGIARWHLEIDPQQI